MNLTDEKTVAETTEEVVDMDKPSETEDVDIIEDDDDDDDDDVDDSDDEPASELID